MRGRGRECERDPGHSGERGELACGSIHRSVSFVPGNVRPHALKAPLRRTGELPGVATCGPCHHDGTYPRKPRPAADDHPPRAVRAKTRLARTAQPTAADERDDGVGPAEETDTSTRRAKSRYSTCPLRTTACAGPGAMVGIPAPAPAVVAVASRHATTVRADGSARP